MHHPDTRAQMEQVEEEARQRGFPDIRCLRCGDPDGAVSIDLHDVSTFRCSQCEAEWTAAEVRAQLDAWGAVLRWVEAAPALQE